MATLLSYALTDVNSVKESLGIASSVTKYDNLIVRKINQATGVIEALCDRRFLETTYTNEEYDGTDTDELILKQRPITGLTSFQLRSTGLNTDDWEDVESDLYFREDNSGIIKLLFRARGRWNRYRLTYSAGYATIPADLAEAAASLAAFYVNEADASSINIQEKEEGQRRIRFAAKATSIYDVMQQLGIDSIVNSYANKPLGG